MAADELTLAQALEQLARCLSPVAQTEPIDTRDAGGRILAEDVASAIDLPAFDNSAMDGYALRFADLQPGHRLREIGRAYAGHPFAGRVETGTCVRIMTGAPLPDGADTVAMVEDVTVEDGTVRVQRPPRQEGANIRRRGEHTAAGDVVLRTRRHLRAADLGLAAAVGAARLTVRRRLRVGIVSTGDELADPPARLTEAASYDANRPLLCASLGRLGFESQDLGICRDTSQAFAATLQRARRLRLDALLASGGAAQGDADIVRTAADVRFVPLNIRPGRGVAFARFDDGGTPMALLGLPGNAVAAYVMFHLLARPLLLHLAGGEAAIPLHFPLPLAGSVRLRGARIDYRRARFVRDASGSLRVEPLRDQGSAMLRTITDADALVALGPREVYADGDLVDTVPLALLD
jgi:molybdopterin molybdotransferase